MKRFPLYARILLWFFLNLLVLAGAIAAVLIFQIQAGPELFLGGRAGERLQSVAQIITDELNTQPNKDWDATLQRFGAAYHVRFLLYRNEGGQLAGTVTTLPPSVARRVFTPGAARREGRAPRDSAREPELNGQPRPGGRPLLQMEPALEGPGFRGPPRGPRDTPRVRDTFITRTSDPGLYWIGLRMAVIERPPERPVPATLILVTDSLNAGGLLMDFTPFLWVGGGALLFSVLFWLPLVRSITRSLAQMNQATAQIAEGKFEVRVNEKRRDELGELGRAINVMASRLAGFVTGQKRFTGDIAHELCSPIARMQMVVGILEERADPKDKQYVEDLREEVQHISSLVNELLSFSKASLGATSLRLESVVLRPLAEKAARREARNEADVRVDIPEDLTAIADPELVVRALANLIRNAVRYAGEAGPITITASQLEGEVELVVADSGSGVPDEELPKLFDPFYRVDTSRARETGGIGLGLSIVKTCIESCLGSVTCRNRQPSGLEVVIRLPA